MLQLMPIMFQHAEPIFIRRSDCVLSRGLFDVWKLWSCVSTQRMPASGTHAVVKAIGTMLLDEARQKGWISWMALMCPFGIILGPPPEAIITVLKKCSRWLFCVLQTTCTIHSFEPRLSVNEISRFIAIRQCLFGNDHEYRFWEMSQWSWFISQVAAYRDLPVSPTCIVPVSRNASHTVHPDVCERFHKRAVCFFTK